MALCYRGYTRSQQKGSWFKPSSHLLSLFSTLNLVNKYNTRENISPSFNILDDKIQNYVQFVIQMKMFSGFLGAK